MRTCLNQPVRTIWAKAAASFRSVLFGRILSAAFAWRASMQTTGKPLASSSFQSHTAVFIPIRPRPVAFSATHGKSFPDKSRPSLGAALFRSRQRDRLRWSPGIRRALHTEPWHFPFSLRRTGRLANRASVGELPPAWRAASPGDYAKWSALRYGFRAKEDHDAEEETQARGDCCEAAPG